MIGTVLDKYEVLQKVGEGGMATVYRGRHCTLDRDVAIKVLHPHLSSSSRNRKRFAREARAIEHLRHDNILEIFDYSGLDASDCYIITEFVQGETLTELLRARRKLPSEVVAIIGSKLAEALAYAHEQGILHRDLKPDNVMVRLDGTVKLMDFGIARFLDESQVTMTGALVGSPAFMSPEQAREGDLDHRSDLFALGTTLFHLVTGTLPFSGSNPSLILKNVIEGNRPAVAELVPDMSASLADVIERLMAGHPDERFDHARDVVDALELALVEADVDPGTPEWSLTHYLTEPDAYEAQLQEHLTQVLLSFGTARLEAGDHLAALRLFNRLLAIDEDNEEVLELVRGLHDEPESRVGGATLVVLASLLALLGGFVFVWMWTTESPSGAIVEPEGAAVITAPSTPDEAAPTVQADSPEPEPVSPGVPTVEGSDRMPPPLPVIRPKPRPSGPQPTVAAAETFPAVVPPAPPVGEADEPAQLQITSSNDLWGDVYVEGRLRARTRGQDNVIDLDPGIYEVEIRGPQILTYKMTVELAPGDQISESVELQPKPSNLLFSKTAYPGDCVVLLDDARMGTLQQLEYRLQVKRPNKPHFVEVRCSSGIRMQRDYRFVGDGDVFPDASDTSP